jgi:hypothetical protein
LISGFWPFTKAVGGITPCWSSISTVEPPTLTLEKDAKTKEKPTSAVVNIVWSMRFEVADPGGGGLSTAAKAGIGAGAGVAVILIAGLAICLWRSRRKNKKLAEAQQSAPPAQAQMQQQQLPFKQPQMMPQANVPNGQYPPGTFHPGMAAMPIPPPSDRTSTVTSGISGSPAALIPQHTGTSGGGVSELSSQNGQNLLHNGQPGYFAGGRSGTGSPAVGVNGQGYPAPIAETDEGHQQQHYSQYGYQHQHPQQYAPQPQQQHYPTQQQQQQYYGASPVQQMLPQGQGQGQYYPHPQAGYAYPPQQQAVYSQNVPVMSANREADPPQEVMGSQVQHHHAG